MENSAQLEIDGEPLNGKVPFYKVVGVSRHLIAINHTILEIWGTLGNFYDFPIRKTTRGT
jgi:hypothetical protein